MDNTGKLRFRIAGTLGGSAVGVTPAGYADGLWHLAVLAVPAIGTIALSVDGTSVVTAGSLTALTGGATYWHVGWADFTGIANAPTSAYLAGSLSGAFVRGATTSTAEATTLATRTSAVAYRTAVTGLSAISHLWMLGDTGTTTYTGTLPTADPCTMLGIVWAFVTPSSTVSGALSVLDDGVPRPVSPPGAGVTQTSTITTSRNAAFTAAAGGLLLRAPITYAVSAGATTLSFSWPTPARRSCCERRRGTDDGGRRGGTTRERLRRVAGLGVLVVVLAALAYAGWFRLSGGHWERVDTPSMGTTAPVGTLLWVAPTDPATLREGDFITFRPPGSTGTTFSHRVVALDDTGALGTGGEISSTDPWPLADDTVVGKVVHVWPGVGWLVLAAPYLLVGGLVTAALVAVARGRGRLPIAVLGMSVTLTIAAIVLQPFIRAEQLAFVPTEDGARATYVSTGLLPIRLEASRADHVDLSAGEVGSVLTTVRESDGKVAVDLRPHIPVLFWILLVLGCFVPALWTLVVGVPVPEPRHHARHQSPRPA